MPSRLLIVRNGGKWYIRRVRLVEHYYDPPLDEKVYHCDRHLGGLYKTFDEAAKVVKALGVK
jgi:hypothetical protein